MGLGRPFFLFARVSVFSQADSTASDVLDGGFTTKPLRKTATNPSMLTSSEEPITFTSSNRSNDRSTPMRTQSLLQTNSSYKTITTTHSVSFRLSLADVNELTPIFRPKPFAKPKDRGVIRRLRRLAESIRLWHDKHGKELPEEYVSITPPSLAVELDKIEKEQASAKRYGRDKRKNHTKREGQSKRKRRASLAASMASLAVSKSPGTAQKFPQAEFHANPKNDTCPSPVRLEKL
ncbi:hypothetical protein BIW11_12947 [Tropilaelaps mercedesae]|uniref:Uncharacterized protein n=1 Tax=Tropilaelaps mercedesae TaxID=418985 RepID=A0A1V9X476_9ACAR|nr:hypothetical protein BIW11_12947 [Tropilaelaps mercedesae]